jgi:hypothetical protein
MELTKLDERPKGLDLFVDKREPVIIISFTQSESESERHSESESERHSENEEKHGVRFSYELEIRGRNLMYDIYTDIRHNPSARLVYEIWRRLNLRKFVLFIDVKYNMDEGEVYVVSRKLKRNNTPLGLDINTVNHIKEYLIGFLRQIHEIGFTHGDFTDSNILWDGNVPYVIDFESTVDQVEFKTDFSFFKMIDYADLVRVLNKINPEYYRSALNFANQIKELEDDIIQDRLNTDKKIILRRLNEEMMKNVL